MTKSPNFTVRPATTDDAEAIGTIQTQSWQTTYVGSMSDLITSILKNKDIQRPLIFGSLMNNLQAVS